ncbi:MAG TPA: AraC family transcriptional regulator [Segetibacter sp.]|jgi:AraC-like DNA-binding protein
MICNTLNPSGALDTWAWSCCNRITFSSLSSYDLKNYQAPTYSIKYVLQGTEHYFFNNRKYPVGKGSFLLVNKQQPIDFSIHSEKKVVGLCIHLDPDFLKNVFTCLTQNEGWLLDNERQFIEFPEFEELLYGDKENSLGGYLNSIASGFDSKTASVSLDENELYHNLAFHLFKLQNAIPTQGDQIAVLRNSTRNELLRRVALAKDIMDAYDNEVLDIETIARQSMLSGSHLFRTFKKVYGISPYQYYLKQRMRRAADLLSSKKMKVTEAAFEFGFPDLASFSKAFKKAHRLSPIKYLKAG